MIPVYRAISAEKGTGMMRRMHGNMETEMQKRRLFPHIRGRIREEMLQRYVSLDRCPPYAVSTAFPARGLTLTRAWRSEHEPEHGNWNIAKSWNSFNSTASTLTCHIAQMCKSLEEQMGTYMRAEMAGPNMNQEDVEKVRRAIAMARGGSEALEALAAKARDKAKGLGYT